MADSEARIKVIITPEKSSQDRSEGMRSVDPGMQQREGGIDNAGAGAGGVTREAALSGLAYNAAVKSSQKALDNLVIPKQKTAQEIHSEVIKKQRRFEELQAIRELQASKSLLDSKEDLHHPDIDADTRDALLAQRLNRYNRAISESKRLNTPEPVDIRDIDTIHNIAGQRVRRFKPDGGKLGKYAPMSVMAEAVKNPVGAISTAIGVDLAGEAVERGLAGLSVASTVVGSPRFGNAIQDFSEYSKVVTDGFKTMLTSLGAWGTLERDLLASGAHPQVGAFDRFRRQLAITRLKDKIESDRSIKANRLAAKGFQRIGGFW